MSGSAWVPAPRAAVRPAEPESHLARFTERPRGRHETRTIPPDLASALADPPVARPRPRPQAGSEHAPRPWQRTYVIGLLLGDAATALAGSLGAAALSGTLRAGRDLIFVPLYLICWVLALTAGRTYESRRLGVGPMEFARVLRSGMGLFGVVALADVLLGLTMGRPAVLAIALTVALDLGARGLFRRRLYRARWRGDCTDRVIAVGCADSLAHIVATLRTETHHGLEIVGACLVDVHVPGSTPDDVEQLLEIPVLGGLGDVPAAVAATGARMVAVAAGAELAPGALRELAWSLESRGTELLVSPGLAEVAGPRLTVRPYPNMPLLHVEQPRLSGAARAVKGIADPLMAGLLAVLLAPLLALIALLIRCTSPGPAFFRQTRIGLDGEPFQLWKFRSMVADADGQLPVLDPHNEKDAVLFKMRRDPRVTRLGAILRRFSLDELPQLFNVCGGSMSLVGPRPPLLREVEQYGRDMSRRLLVKPGITGLWQVSGRSDLSWDESVRLDLRYVENWSVGLDASILWRTLSAVVSGRGAY